MNTKEDIWLQIMSLAYNVRWKSMARMPLSFLTGLKQKMYSFIRRFSWQTIILLPVFNNNKKLSRQTEAIILLGWDRRYAEPAQYNLINFLCRTTQQVSVTPCKPCMQYSQKVNLFWEQAVQNFTQKTFYILNILDWAL